MPLHCWCYLLGLLGLLAGASVALAPAPLARLARAFPRHAPTGYVLSTLAWLWAGLALWNMGLDILMPYQKFIPLLVLACIPLTWFWLDNLLPCRALGGLLVLFPYELLHAARVHPSAWRLVLVTLAYVCIVKGMALLLYPWRLRQAVVWLTERPALFRLSGALNAALGLGLIALGAAVLR